MTSGLDYAVAGCAGALAGGINALAGGGSLVSFPVLHYVGLSSIDANVTNIVALTPGYATGSYGQRRDLLGQGHAAKTLGVCAGLGAVVGSVLLVTVAAGTFTDAVPYLILLACATLALQGPVRRWLDARRQRMLAGDVAAHEGEPAASGRRWAERVTVFACAIYGGFFGAGLGIMFLAVLAFFTPGSLIRTNALKQVLSLIVSVMAAAFLSFTGRVEWGFAGVVAAAALLGGFAGGRLVRRVPPGVLRVLVVCYGVGVAIRFWV